MDILTDSHPITRLEIVDTGRRRRWSESEKIRIVEESLSAPRLASATARRHGISNQLLFAWRKAYREGRLGDEPGFVPAKIVPDLPETRPEPVCHPVEIVSPSGWRVLMSRECDEHALMRVLRLLEGLR
ncbi:IS66-like element accessory protein TnpA [Microvirga guangxiensis]|uniref:Transposase n=1 Tax=Microvirga guangxiensis TaxID=549386 RepID=A0A1G5LP40_9HYPH|nr:transposase [Microvirga guangxiensis]SCZ14653.1 transposase [Microvirga guangxiensis]